MAKFERQLSVLQRIAACGNAGEESPFGHGRRSAVLASAWHRTVTVLARKGLVRRERWGDHYKATVTEAGRDSLTALQVPVTGDVTPGEGDASPGRNR